MISLISQIITLYLDEHFDICNAYVEVSRPFADQIFATIMNMNLTF